MSNVKLINVNQEDRIKVLKKLGYSINKNGFIIKAKTKKEVFCKYSEEKIHINNAAILPGSTLVINTNPFTMAQYYTEYLDNDE